MFKRLLDFLLEMPVEKNDVEIKKHAKYFSRFLNLLPSSLSSHDSTRYVCIFYNL